MNFQKLNDNALIALICAMVLSSIVAIVWIEYSTKYNKCCCEQLKTDNHINK